MLGVEDQSIFTDYEEAETREPRKRKPINEVRTIYSSRAFRRPRENQYGLPVLCDFGEARIGTPQAYTEIQPEVYKSPEILMQFDWGHAADIWNVACLVRNTSVSSLFSTALNDSSCGRCWRLNVSSMAQTTKDYTTIAIMSMRW